MRTTMHCCGGTILEGGAGAMRHLYCDRCGAFVYGADAEAREVPSGTDRDANREAWDAGASASPDADR